MSCGFNLKSELTIFYISLTNLIIQNSFMLQNVSVKVIVKGQWRSQKCTSKGSQGSSSAHFNS